MTSKKEEIKEKMDKIEEKILDKTLEKLESEEESNPDSTMEYLTNQVNDLVNRLQFQESVIQNQQDLIDKLQRASISFPANSTGITLSENALVMLINLFWNVKDKKEFKRKQLKHFKNESNDIFMKYFLDVMKMSVNGPDATINLIHNILNEALKEENIKKKEESNQEPKKESK